MSRFVAATAGLIACLAWTALSQPFSVAASLTSGSGNGPFVVTTETFPGSGIWDIDIELSGATRPSMSTKAILSITVSNALGQPTTFSIGNITINATDSLPYDGIEDLIVDLRLGTNTATLAANIGHIELGEQVFDTSLHMTLPSRVLGNIERIVANYIADLTINGSLGEVVIPLNQGIVASTNVAIERLVVSQNLSRIFCTDDGAVVNVLILGDMGSPEVPVAVSIRSPLAWPASEAAVGRFECKNFYGDFQLGATTLAGMPNLSRLFVDGDQFGMIYCPFVIFDEQAPIEVTGDLGGELIIGSIYNPSLTAHPVRIGGDILASGRLSVLRRALSPTLFPFSVLKVGSQPGNGDIFGVVEIGSEGLSPDVSGSAYWGSGVIEAGFDFELDGSIMPSGEVVIHGNMRNDAVVNIRGRASGSIVYDGVEPFAGQVIVNSDAVGLDLLSGSIAMGITAPISLSPVPNYANLSAEIGGGAVGVVPFNLHAPDCEPPSGSLITVHTGLNGIQAPQEVRIRHYGPVRFASAGAQLLVERSDFTYSAPPIGPTIWEDVSASYQFAASSENPRDLIVSGNFGPDYRYRIRPNGQVLCAGNSILDSGSFPVFDYTYNLRVRTPLDRNMNGMMEFGDIELQVADPIDINGDTAADVLDLAEVIQAVANP